MEFVWLDPERKQYGPFLRLLKAEKLSSVTILELMRLQTISGYTNGMKTAATVISVGKAVENEYNAEQIKKKNNRKMVGDYNCFDGIVCEVW